MKSKQSLSRLLIALTAVAGLSVSLSGCFPVVAGGMAAGALIAADRRTSGTFVDDEAIELKANKQILEKLGDRVHVNVTSFNRTVLLTGEAFNDAAKASIEPAMAGIPNIRSVINEVVVAPTSSLATRSNDTYLTSKVKARMVDSKRFFANNIKVVTENGVVFLLGLVTRAEADAATDVARTTGGVRRVVRAFEYISDEQAKQIDSQPKQEAPAPVR